MSTETFSIAFLGPFGTYSHETALYFAEELGDPEAELLECASFDEVFDAVDRGRTTYGVVAKENSLEGPVTSTLDNFAFRSSSVILAEKVFDIHHCLMTAPEADLTQVKTIASHLQGIAQCRRYLNERFPGRGTQVTPSTAESARLAATDPTIASIANPLAAKLYGCTIQDESIEDNLGNQTAFALIGRLGSAPILEGERFKTTVALFLRVDRAGTLNMILSEFAYADINLTMVQSRPLKQQLGDYMFFMEFEGKDTDLSAQTALACLRLKLREVKVLGSYPML